MNIQVGSLVIENGQVWLPSGHVVNEPVWIEQGRIRAIGKNAISKQLRGVERLDASGGSVLPGFQDGHVHPHHWAARQLGCDLSEAASGEDALQAIAEYEQHHRDREWVTGGGWVLSLFGNQLPTKEMLDAVVPDRPAYFPYTDGHGAWVNSRALEIAGIDARTPDPQNGRINRDSRGEPTGILEEQAMHLVAELIPAYSTEELDHAFMRAYRQLTKWGIVGWQDAMVGSSRNWPDNFDSYLSASSSGRLKSRVVGALLWDPMRGLDQIEELREKREQSRQAGPHFDAGSVKIFQDGVIENYTAGLLNPYLDRCGHETENSGQSIVEPEFLKTVVAELSRHAFQVHFHALGDRAVREALDAIEYAQHQTSKAGLRHTIAHIQLIHPEDIPRFASLGVVANSQELWACHEPEMDDLTIPFLGPDRSRLQYPFGSLLASGAVIAGGSDWPVSTADPLQIIHTAVNRDTYRAGETGHRSFNVEQSLSLPDALRAHTSSVAFLNHDDHRSGTIESGKAGDIVVLDRDIFTHPLNEIGATEVQFTVLGGEVTYSKS